MAERAGSEVGGGAGVAERSVSLPDLEREAAALWRELGDGAVLWLTGEIGAGKTAFVQSLARAAGASPARSPTFALVHEYPSSQGPIIHVDCFRLRDPEEAHDLDFPSLLGHARLLIVEWPERAGSVVPPPDAHVHLTHLDRPDRRGWERKR